MQDRTFPQADPLATVASLRSWLDALPPGPPGPSQRLARLRPAEGGALPQVADLLELAQALNAGWIKGHPEPAPQARQALLACVRLAWPPDGLPPELDHPLLTPSLQAESALGQPQGLLALCAARAPALCAPNRAGLLRLVLRLVRRQRLGASLVHLLPALAQQPEPPWPLELAQALAMASRQARHPTDLVPLVPWLGRLLPGCTQRFVAGSTDEDAATLHSALSTLALRCVDLPALRALTRLGLAAAHAAAEGPPRAAWALPLGRLLDARAQMAHDPRLVADLDEALGLHPGSALLRMARARCAAVQGWGPAALTALIDGSDADDPAFRRALLWLANTAFFQGDAGLAQACYARAGLIEPLSPADALRLAHLQSRPTDPSDPVDGRAAPPAQEDALDLGALAPTLGGWWTQVMAQPVHGSAPVADWVAQGEAMVADLRARLPAALAAPDAPNLEDVLALWRQLWQLAQQRFLSLSLDVPAFALPWGPAYGQLCPLRGRAAHRAVCAGLAALADAWLMRPEALGDLGSLRHWLELLRLALDADLAQAALDDDNATRAAVQRAEVRLDQVAALLGPDLLREQRLSLAERVRLNQPWPTDDRAAAAPLHAAIPLPPDAEGGIRLPQRDWAGWSTALRRAQAPGAVPAPAWRLDEPALPGHFESVDRSGRCHRYAHQTVAQALAPLPVQGVHVGLSHALWHPQAGLLRPHPWHLTMGDYPYTHPDVCSAGLHGATLRPAAAQPVSEPLLVLANQDAIVHRNFYHWMVLILPRIAWAMAQGGLAQRRLLVPEEMSGWMRGSLTDLGLTEAQLRLYRRDEHLCLDDALVLPPIEFASPALVQGLRERLWRAAGLDPQALPTPTHRLYISRRGENRRPLVSEDALMAQAVDLGYTVVAPETLSLLDQVRLFAQARAVAGPPGAAFTNLMWAQPGTRVLAFFHDRLNLPPFVDLAVLGGLVHRWVLGHTLAGFERTSPLNAPYDVDVGLARRELAWAAEPPAG